MSKFVCKIIDKAGIHARPASIVVATASKFESDIKLHFKSHSANLKSIMNILALGVKSGDEITIDAKGDDEKEAIAEIKKALKENKLI